MKTCAYCGSLIKGKQKSAKYCSDICRLRAYRVRHGIPEPFETKKGSNKPEINFLDTPQTFNLTLVVRMAAFIPR